MANTMSAYGSNTNRPLSEIVGLSTDTKPTDSIEGIKIQNGSSFRELDTGKRFLFDAENTTWNEVSSDGGGGGGSTLVEKSISANGVYNASDDSADGYSKVTVDVANSYTQADEGKVVSNGSLVAQTTHAEITENGTYDITTNNSVSVNVSGGGSEILGSLIDRSITSCNVPNGITEIGAYSFYRCGNLVNIAIPNTVTSIATYAFYMCNSLERVDLTSVTVISTSAFESCASLSTVILGNNLITISSKAFKSTPIKSITIPSSVTSISSNAFSDTYDITITVNKAEGSISGSPWGAQRATVIWNG